MSPITLQAVNHSPISTYGQISRSLDLELRRDFTWIFTVADLPYPILGSDFLHHFNLLVEMRKRRLIDGNTELSVTGYKANTSPISPGFFIAATDDPYQILLRSYPELTNLNFVVSKSTHETTHHIETTGAPVFSRPRRLPADKLKAAKAEFNHMVQLGIIRPSSSPWASPLHIQLKAFNEVKQKLATTSLLVHPVPDAQFSLVADESGTGVGAVLQQQYQQQLQPLAYFPRQLKPAEQRYSTFGRELLAMYVAVKHFQHSLEGRQFVIYNNHRPLTFALRSKPDKYSPRETRHLDFVSQFTNDIRHISGEQNAAEDALSRLPINSLFSPSDIDLRQMALDQPRLDTLDLSSPEFATCKFAYLPVPCGICGHADYL